MQFEYKIEQILMDRNINESDPLIKVANTTKQKYLQYLSCQ